jgi:hypothetical protein
MENSAMKKLTAVIAVAVAFAFGPTLVAEAEECPPLIKKLTERLDRMPDYVFKKGRAQRIVAEAQKLQDEGKPAECVEKMDEAANSLR